jgi:hypothetical protein
MAIVHLVNNVFSGYDGTPRLYDISIPGSAGPFPLLIIGHGYDGSKSSITDEIKERFCTYGCICAAMTTRKDSGGLEILDFPYLVSEIESAYSESLDGRRLFCGYSGGGGNGYSLLVKCPDLFHAVIIYFGMNDYAQWWANAPSYRSSIEDKIGGTPAELPNAYAARNSVVAIANNKKAYIFILHDESDDSVLIENADNWVSAADAAEISYSYTRTDSEVETRAIHGYPIVGTVGEPNIQFETTVPPQWVTALLASEKQDISIASSGALICGAFLKTSKFELITGNDNRCLINYIIDPLSISINNTDTGNAADARLKIFGLNNNSIYRCTVNGNTKYCYTDASGTMTLFFQLSDGATTLVNNFLEVDNMPKPSTLYCIATLPVTIEAITDFVFKIDLSLTPSGFKALWNTNDNGYGRVYKEDGTELPSDWRNLDHESKTGELWFKYSGDWAGGEKVHIYPPNTNNDCYAADSTYGKNATYTGAVAIWPLDADLTERTGKAYPLSANNGAVLQAGGGYQFDGDNDYIAEGVGARIPAETLQSSFTVVLTINPDTYGESNYGMIIDKCLANDSTGGFVIAMANTLNKIYARVNAGSLIASNADAAVIGSLSRVVVSFNTDGTIKFYSNGSPKGSGSSGALAGIASTGPIYVGSYASTTFAFDGFVRTVEIWSGEKSAAWVAEDYLQRSDQGMFWGELEYAEPVINQSDKLIAGIVIHI